MHFFNCHKHGKKELDKSGYVGTSITDLSNAYDCCLSHDIIITKLGFYGFDSISLKSFESKK